MATQARSIASLTISFGLVAIPVKLYSATVSSERISFNLLRQKDGSRVKQQYVAVAETIGRSASLGTEDADANHLKYFIKRLF